MREQEATHDDICSLKATINDIKRDINQFEENGIVVDADPLIINQNLVYIEQWTSNELDLSTLSSPYRTIACSQDKNRTNDKKRIELRSSSTFDQLWSTTFNASYRLEYWMDRVCVLKYNEWLVIDYGNSRLFHVSKDGQVKSKCSYKPTINNAVLFGTNILVIKTLKNVNCYRIY
ncbi:unnamed protein product [Rotaria magnacalcarata]|uniref:Uncharacterized protein n=1 Tax=Rotaria magnacalcarata TaxID=392030 RepID=A0A820RK27_9BILA|nr:unnamed protein product [Rotaria magnacalcarata]